VMPALLALMDLPPKAIPDESSAAKPLALLPEGVLLEVWGEVARPAAAAGRTSDAALHRPLQGRAKPRRRQCSWSPLRRWREPEPSSKHRRGDRGQARHPGGRASRYRGSRRGPERPLLVPALVVTEVSYLLADRIGPYAELAFSRSIADGEVVIEPVLDPEWERVEELTEQYLDLSGSWMPPSSCSGSGTTPR
jgi:hypothetical protein